jgi:hypothetical protein
MSGIVPTPEEVDKAYRRVGMLFMDLMSAYQSAQKKASLLSADTEARYAPILAAIPTEADPVRYETPPSDT